MAKVIQMKRTAAKAAPAAMPEHLAEKTALLRLALRGLRSDHVVSESEHTAVETLAYEVECLISDGKLPWETLAGAR
jgi:hypothetical protein